MIPPQPISTLFPYTTLFRSSKLFRQQNGQARHRSAHHFTYSNFLCPLLGSKRCQREKAEACNKNCKSCKNRKYFSHSLFGTKQLIKTFVKKSVFKRLV